MKTSVFLFSSILFLCSWISVSEAKPTTPPICPEEEPCQLPSPRQNEILGAWQLARRLPICPEDKPCYIPRSPDYTIHITSPTKSFIFYNEMPQTIAWQPIPEVNRYSVSIQHASQIVWETIVSSQTEIPYPANLQLETGKDYQVIIRADANDLEGRITFRMLSEAETQSIQSQAQEIAKNPHDTESQKALKLAFLYSDSHLFGEAIQTLLEAVENNNSSVEIYQQLGNLYLDIQQHHLAKPYYEKVLSLATHLEEEANAQFKLAVVSSYENNLDEVVQFLTVAKSNYEQLGEQALVAQITTWLQKVYAIQGE